MMYCLAFSECMPVEYSHGYEGGKVKINHAKYLLEGGRIKLAVIVSVNQKTSKRL